MKTIGDAVKILEQLAPPAYQESYDNARLIVGNPKAELKGVLTSLDSTEEIVDEALEKGCNMIVAHHPIVFSGLKSLTGRNYIERTIIKAIKNDIAIYAIHTNLDNVKHGVNKVIADKLGLTNQQILMPKKDTLTMISFYCPTEACDRVLEAVHAAGAGEIGDYDYCSFQSDGTGSFRANENANPHVGEKGKIHQEPERKLEVVCPVHLMNKVVSAMKKAHPYEEVAYYCHQLHNSNTNIGTGIIGELTEAKDALSYLKEIKQVMKVGCLRHTDLVKKEIRKVAVVGGSGSFALGAAIAQGADLFVTADYKYHQFFDADGHLIIADIGHYESEQYTIELLASHLKKKLPNFAVLFTERNTNPVKYL